MTTRGFRSQLHKALAEIGRDNGHAPPPGGHNIDPLLHYYMVDTEAASFFGAQRKASQQSMLEVLPDESQRAIVDCVADAKEQESKQPTVLLFSSDRYVLNLNVKKPAKRPDVKKIRSRLVRDGRYTVGEVNKLFADCEETNEPSKIYTVSTRAD